MSSNFLKRGVLFKFNVQIRPMEEKKDDICLYGIMTKNSICPHS